MSPAAEAWIDAMIFGLRELFLQAMTCEEIKRSLDAWAEVRRLASEARA